MEGANVVRPRADYKRAGRPSAKRGGQPGAGAVGPLGRWVAGPGDKDKPPIVS